MRPWNLFLFDGSKAVWLIIWVTFCLRCAAESANCTLGAVRATWEAEKCLAWKVSGEVRARSRDYCTCIIWWWWAEWRKTQIIWELLPSIHPSDAARAVAPAKQLATHTGALWETSCTMRDNKCILSNSVDRGGHFCFISAHHDPFSSPLQTDTFFSIIIAFKAAGQSETVCNWRGVLKFELGRPASF